MASTNKTPAFGLSSWLETDSPLRTDFNSDNEIIDRELLHAADSAGAAWTAAERAMYTAVQANTPVFITLPPERTGVIYDNFSGENKIDKTKTTLFESSGVSVTVPDEFIVPSVIDAGYDIPFNGSVPQAAILVFDVPCACNITKLEYRVTCAVATTATITVCRIDADGRTQSAVIAPQQGISAGSNGVALSATTNMPITAGRYGIYITSPSNQATFSGRSYTGQYNPSGMEVRSVPSTGIGVQVGAPLLYLPSVRLTVTLPQGTERKLVTKPLQFPEKISHASMYVTHKGLRGYFGNVKVTTDAGEGILYRDEAFSYANASADGEERFTGTFPPGNEAAFEIGFEGELPTTGKILNYMVI